jgi:hypothetical protein
VLRLLATLRPVRPTVQNRAPSSGERWQRRVRTVALRAVIERCTSASHPVSSCYGFVITQMSIVIIPLGVIAP